MAAGQPTVGGHMNGRIWGPSGIGKNTATLSQDAREQITIICKPHAKDPAAIAAFLSALDGVVLMTVAIGDVSKRSSPSKVRSLLAETQAQASQLYTTLIELDHNTIQLINQDSRDIRLDALNMLERLLPAVAAARRVANDYPSSGALKNHAALTLAAGTAFLMRQHLRTKPSGQSGGLLCQIAPWRSAGDRYQRYIINRFSG